MRARVVLLGASNVVLGFRSAVRAARERLGAPLEVVAAAGHGRSYGVESKVLTRCLPSISACNLWQTLRERPATSTYAVVTDIGNDVGYGSDPAQVQLWLEEVLDRLAAVKAQTVITGLPLAAIRRLPDWEFFLFSRLFYPQRRIDRARVTAAAEELDARIDRMARERGLVRIAPRSEWYEHDPIHIALSAQREAWRAYVAAWKLRDGTPNGMSFNAPWRQHGWRVPEKRTLFGREAGRPQPCAKLADGTQFFLY